MPYVAKNPNVYLTNPPKHFGESQECVALVKFAAAAPQTSKWLKGRPAKGNKLTTGTAIATFDEAGKYGYDKLKYPAGSPHAALYLKQDQSGLHVIDQWKRQPAHVRVIRFKNGGGSPANDGDQFFVIELDLTFSHRA